MTDSSVTANQAPIFRALALQTLCPTVNGFTDIAEARAEMMRTLARIDRQIAAARGFIGPDVKLVVLPEYFLTGYPLGESIQGWRAKAAFEFAGPEYEKLGEMAQRHGTFIAGNAYEGDPNFADIYFQTSFLVDPSGAVVLRYRRLISMFAPSPYDVWDKYLDVYGIDGVFPVAETALGRVAAIASEEILYPEIARAHALRGAEIFLHSSGEAMSALMTPKDVAKRARAIENLAYVVSANSGGMSNTGVASASSDGLSKIVDFTGLVLAEAGQGETMNAHAELDLNALRRWRRRPGMPNMLSRLPTPLFEAAYRDRPMHPGNTMLEHGALKVPERAYFQQRQRQVIERLAESGVI